MSYEFDKEMCLKCLWLRPDFILFHFSFSVFRFIP